MRRTLHATPARPPARAALAAALAALLLLAPEIGLAPATAQAQGALAQAHEQIRRSGCDRPGHASAPHCRALHERARMLAGENAPALPAAAPPRRPGLFERLFGLGAPDSRRGARPDPRHDDGREQERHETAPDPRYDYGFPHAGETAAYRTVCVRLCDGYYWPVSHAATRRQFAADEARCQASCAAPAKLFIDPDPGGAPDRMTDLSGRPYAALPAAFSYRKTYDEACRCRPDPWTEAAQREYAARGRVEVAETPPVAAARDGEEDAAEAEAWANASGAAASRPWTAEPGRAPRYDTHGWRSAPAYGSAEPPGRGFPAFRN